ncbi:MAG: Colicin V production protein [Parcubacteria group bacterium GW2011_GWC2_45_7]|nr:MAG: Colicin V production protein [Parcubacteria group bacterium GW2011_GWC2_45_7]KKU73717.1 MAG: Colicin V production protein [Parcubacteria group bacterium GW2011_GWA2_47_26]
MITPFDLILILIVFSFFLFGLWFGLVHAVGGLLGTLLGAIISSRYFSRFAETNTGRVISFAVLFAITSRLTGFVFYGIEKVINIARIIPGIKTLNRLLGGFLGFAEGAIVVGVALFFATRFPVGNLNAMIARSELAQFFMTIGGVVIPLLPRVLREVQEASRALP